jgi:hypothetical protein
MLMRSKSIRAVVLGLGLMLATGCGTTMLGGGAKTEYRMTGASAAPAAQGRVTVKPESNGNQEVDVAVEHLAAPSRAFEGTSVYVVWLVPANGGGPQNMGVLSTSDELNGHLKIQTTFKSFEILVSAEAAPNVVSPSGKRVLSAIVQLPT